MPTPTLATPIAMDCGTTGDLEALVTPPDGLKHRLLEAASRQDLVGGMRAGMEGMIATGTAGCADFREGGIEGVLALQEAAARVVLLSRSSSVVKAARPWPAALGSAARGTCRIRNGWSGTRNGQEKRSRSTPVSGMQRMSMRALAYRAGPPHPHDARNKKAAPRMCRERDPDSGLPAVELDAWRCIIPPSPPACPHGRTWLHGLSRYGQCDVCPAGPVFRDGICLNSLPD